MTTGRFVPQDCRRSMNQSEPNEQARLHAELQDAVKRYEPKPSMGGWLARVLGPKLERILTPVFTRTVFRVAMVAAAVGLVVWLYVLAR